MTSLAFPPVLFDDLAEHMNRRPEQVAFMLATRLVNGVMTVRNLRIVGNDRFALLDENRAEPDDELRGEVVRWAWNNDLCLVEAHSHGRRTHRVCFSGFDFEQFEEWVPHLWWRLQHRPYAALVLAGEAIDGLAWLDSAHAPVAIETIVVEGRDPQPTTGASYERLARRRR
jgi:hypothetical protein